MALSASEKIRRFYSCFSGEDHVLVLIVADPDAIASAMAVKRLLWRKVAHVTIAHVNMVKRPDNLAMIRLLGTNLIHVDQLGATQRFSRIVMVDSQPNHNEAFAGFKVDVLIDHHPVTGIQVPFIDIRPKYGATASIMTEYLRAAKIKPSAKLATALLLAIKTDTDNFVRQTLIEDVLAFQFVFRHANKHLVWKIEHAEMQLDFLKYFKVALAQMKFRKGRIFAHIGRVINPDVCVLIADFFMHVDAAGWSIISGLYDKRLVLIFRNDGVHKNAGKTAKQSFGHIGSAGGHKSMARAEIPLEALKSQIDYQDDRKLLTWIIKSIEKRAEKK